MWVYLNSLLALELYWEIWAFFPVYFVTVDAYLAALVENDDYFDGLVQVEIDESAKISV